MTPPQSPLIAVNRGKSRLIALDRAYSPKIRLGISPGGNRGCRNRELTREPRIAATQTRQAPPTTPGCAWIILLPTRQPTIRMRAIQQR